MTPPTLAAALRPPPMISSDSPAPSVLPALSARAADSIFACLQRSNLWRAYHQAFEAIVGLPLELRHPESFSFPLQGSRCRNPFCGLMSTRNRSCAGCLRLQQRLQDEAMTAPHTAECPTGMRESAVPLRVGTAVIGFLRTGQVFLQRPSRAALGRTLRDIGVDRGSEDGARLEQAFLQTRVMPEAQYVAALELLQVFAHQLEAWAGQLVAEEAQAEPPVITKARAFMRENLAMPLHLADVARAAHVSPYYFCKLFSRSNGQTFTRHLAQLRVAAARDRLLQPNARVGDVAYETGFQSLSQFNRVFRRETGESPSAYRVRMQANVPSTSLAGG